MHNRECIVFEWTHDTEQRIHEPCACLWVPACSSCPQPIIGWIYLQHTHIAVAFACWNFFIVTVIHDFSKQIKQSTRISKIFARWHLVIAITTKKIDIIQCITHYTNTLTKWKVTCKMAWDIGLVLFEHFYVHVKVHKDAKKKNETNIQPPCSNKLGQLLEAKLNMWFCTNKARNLSCLGIAKQTQNFL